MAKAIQILQSDREAAADLYGSFIAGAPGIEKQIRNGELDSHPFVNAFAVFRAALVEDVRAIASETLYNFSFELDGAQCCKDVIYDAEGAMDRRIRESQQAEK